MAVVAQPWLEHWVPRPGESRGLTPILGSFGHVYIPCAHLNSIALPVKIFSSLLEATTPLPNKVTFTNWYLITNSNGFYFIYLPSYT